MESTLADLLERAKSRPKAARDELIRTAAEIEKEHSVIYALSGDERIAVTEALADIDAGNFASDADIAAIFNRQR